MPSEWLADWITYAAYYAEVYDIEEAIELARQHIFRKEETP